MVTQHPSSNLLCTLLETVHKAHQSVSHVHGIITLRADLNITHVALSRLTDQIPAPSNIGGSGTVSMSRRDVTVEVWHQRPGNLWRVHFLNETHQVVIINGVTAWWGDSVRGYFTNGGSPNKAREDFENSIRHIFDPAGLLVFGRITSQSESRFAGRRGISAQAIIRDVAMAARLDWPIADVYELVIDRELGFLLQLQAFLGNQLYIEYETKELSIDEPFERDLFVGPPNAVIL